MKEQPQAIDFRGCQVRRGETEVREALKFLRSSRKGQGDVRDDQRAPPRLTKTRESQTGMIIASTTSVSRRRSRRRAWNRL